MTGLAVTTFGRAGADRTVLLLHGFGVTGLEQYPPDGLPARLAARGAFVIVPDLLGFGSSPDPRRTIPLEDQLGAVVATLDAFGAAPSAMAGYSMGARLAWSLLVDGLAVERVLLGGLPAKEPFLGVDVEDLSARAAEHAVGDPIVAALRRSQAAGGNPFGVMRGLIAAPFAPAAVETAADVLLVAGDADGLAAPERLAGLIPGARATRVGGTHTEAPSSTEYGAVALAHLLAG